MPNTNLSTLILIAIFAIIAISIALNWRKRAALKPNLANRRHETEAEILLEKEDHENNKKKEEN